MLGSSVVLEYEFGPDHANVFPADPVAFSEMVCPAQYGPVFDALMVGLLFTVTEVLAVAVQPVTVFVKTTL